MHQHLESIGFNLIELIGQLDNLGVYITDRNRRILFWNQGAQRIMGYEAEEVVGKACRENVLCHIDRHGRPLCGEDVCPLFHAIRTGKASTVSSFVFGKHRNGKRIPVSVTVSPLRDAQGDVVGGIELFRDATAEWDQLRMAQGIQRRFMPDPLELSRELPLAYHWLPAEMIGGDVVQVQTVAPGIVFGLFVDVSGHGIASALLTGFLWRALEGVRNPDLRPASVLKELARQYQSLNLETHYFSAVCFRYELAARRLILANAGHPLPVVVERPEPARYLDLTGDLIGLFEMPEFSEQELVMKNARVVIYSDGCVEARDPAGVPFGGERFLRQVEQAGALPGVAAAKHLVEVAFDYTQAPEPEDDMTVLVIDSPA
ncbi:MAG TPA: SpoIIE family protein phosphatase [Candidatus Ozemobacteraceae bacterium]|nr:SpoIIE family protein phosphatase [Candidatus Ozemobacteraceae bacterium]